MTAISIPAELAIRTDFQDPPLGRIGNRAYTPHQGGTRRSSGPGMFARTAYGLRMALAHMSLNPQRRASLRVDRQARAFSASAASLLGALTAPIARPRTASGDSARHILPSAPEAWNKVSATLHQLLRDGEVLEQMRTPSNEARDGLAEKPEAWRPVIDRHVKNLNNQDLSAMLRGIVNDRDGLANLSRQLAAQGRHEGRRIIDHIEQACKDEQVARFTEQPLAALADRLSGTNPDMVKVDAALGELSDGMAMLRWTKEDATPLIRSDSDLFQTPTDASPPAISTLEQPIPLFLASVFRRLTDAQRLGLATRLSNVPAATGAALTTLKNQLKNAPGVYDGATEKQAQREKLLDSLREALTHHVRTELRYVATRQRQTLEHGVVPRNNQQAAALASGANVDIEPDRRAYESMSKRLDAHMLALGARELWAGKELDELRLELKATALAGLPPNITHAYLTTFTSGSLTKLQGAAGAVENGENLMAGIQGEIQWRAETHLENLGREIGAIQGFISQTELPVPGEKLKVLFDALAALHEKNQALEKEQPRMQ